MLKINNFSKAHACPNFTSNALKIKNFWQKMRTHEISDTCEFSNPSNKNYEQEVDTDSISVNYLKKLSSLNDDARNKAYYFISKGAHPENAISMVKLNQKETKRVISLLNRNINSRDAEIISKLSDEEYKKACELLNEGRDIVIDDITDLSRAKEEEYEIRKAMIINGIFSSQASTVISCKKTTEMLKLLDDKVNSMDAYDIIFATRKYYEEYLKEGLSPKTASVLCNLESAKKDEAKKILTKFESFIKQEEYITDYLGNFLEEMPDYELEDFVSYIDLIDIEKIKKSCGEDFSFLDILSFAHRHYIDNTNIDVLEYSGNLTEYLEENFLNADKMKELLSAYPETKREIGEIPNDWLDRTTDRKKAEEEIYKAIGKFQQTLDTKDFEEELSKILNKEVKIKPLEIGISGRGYKISIEGAIDYCIKIFHKIKQNVIKNHGPYCEPQLLIFANNNSGEFVKMYFGKLASRHKKQDAFIVTQFVNKKIKPVPTNPKNNDLYKFSAADVHEGHNKINGVIYDCGAVDVIPKKGYFYNLTKHRA